MKEKIGITHLIDYDQHENFYFASMLSKAVHDINNPLAVYIGQLSIIDLLKKKDQLTEDKLVKIFERFESATQTLENRTNIIRSYYKVLQDDENYKHISHLISALLFYFENITYQAQIKYEASDNLDDDTSLKLANSKVFLVCKHLIQNAVESHFNNKTKNPEITIECVKGPDNLKISIIDNGPGLDCSLAEAISPHYTTKTDCSLGLGLSVAHDVLTNHGLELCYTNHKKTTFSVIFPTN